MNGYVDNGIIYNPRAELIFFGQEINEESYAICKADILIKGDEAKNIAFGNTLDVVISRMAQNEQFFMKILEDSDLNETVMEFMFDEVYEKLSNKAG